MRFQTLQSQKSLKLHDSFDKVIFLIVKSVRLLSFLCAIWKFHKNLIKPRFICAASLTSHMDVSRCLSSFYKAVLPVVSDLWVPKFRKSYVPSGSS
jgi:hypothetical protein